MKIATNEMILGKIKQNKSVSLFTSFQYVKSPAWTFYGLGLIQYHVLPLNTSQKLLFIHKYLIVCDKNVKASISVQ